jgi:hypothetical protein
MYAAIPALATRQHRPRDIGILFVPDAQARIDSIVRQLEGSESTGHHGRCHDGAAAGGRRSRHGHRRSEPQHRLARELCPPGTRPRRRAAQFTFAQAAISDSRRPLPYREGSTALLPGGICKISSASCPKHEECPVAGLVFV